MTTEVLTLRIPQSMKVNLETLGKSIHRSKSYIAEKAIEEYLKRNSWQIKELQLAEEEILQGTFISNDKVNDYLDSWGNEYEKTIS
jgi:RHH-type rel operon transcriptional repressor/antitoxin RelB